MNWPPYHDRTAAPADWLGDLPSHWELDRFRYVFRESDERNGHRIVGDMLAISGYRGVEVKNYDSDELKRSDEDLAKYRVVRIGQLAVNTMWLNYCGLGVSKIEGHMSPDYKAYWIRPDLNRNFLNYLLRSDAYVAGYTMHLTGVRPNSLRINRDSLMSLPVVAPPLKEQEQIAHFLDRETAKIDALIAKQEQLIATLREDRTATITHAVTKGLNRDVEMKDSGVDWLGRIPNHWSVIQLRHVGQPIIGLTYAPEDVVDGPEGSTLVLRSGNIQEGRLDFSDCVYVSGDVPSQLRVQRGDVLLCSRNGSRALIGKNVRITAEVVDQTFGAFMTVVRSEFSPFLFWVFNSRLFDFQTATFLTSTINQLTTGNLKSMDVPFPPVGEQLQIAEHLEDRTRSIDALVAKSVDMIEKLREYRSALITYAVTGKIDVRGAA